MTPNAQRAFDALIEMGVSVMPWGANDGYNSATQFVMISRSDDGNEDFACLDGQRIKEEWIGDTQRNCSNIREDIHAVLERNKLWTEWYNYGQLVIMDGPDATGYLHDDCERRFLAFEARVKAKKAERTAQKQ